MACQDDQLCTGIKAGINGTIHGVQALWDKDLTTENWGFLLVDTKNAFNKINRFGMLWTVRHVWLYRASFYLIVIVTSHCLSSGTVMGRTFLCIAKRA